MARRRQRTVAHGGDVVKASQLVTLLVDAIASDGDRVVMMSLLIGPNGTVVDVDAVVSDGRLVIYLRDAEVTP